MNRRTDVYEDGNPGTMKESKRSSLLQKLITNWLITDPNLYTPNLHNNDKIKNYQVQKHENIKYIYLCGGRLRSVRQRPINVIIGILILIAGILFWVFEAKWVWYHISPSIVILYSYFWLLSILFFIKASTSDAGVLPRNIHMPLSINDGSKIPMPYEYSNVVSLPYYRTAQEGVTVKYCSTCHIWKCPRVSHCSVCNSCIINHDHHCIFLNNCVGFRNYRYFLWFLVSSVITCILMIAPSFVQIFHYRLTPNPSVHNFHQSISKYPIGFVLVIYGLLGLVYPLLLLMFHIFLTSLNITTREYLNNVRVDKSTKDHFINHYDTHSIFKNLYINWIGKPRGSSLVRSRDLYQPGDLRFEKIDSLHSLNL